MGNNHISKMSIFRIVWLICDFLIIWLAVYFLPSPMSDGLRGVDELPLIYNVGLLPILLSFIYFTIWHIWKDIFIKTAIFFVVTIVTFDWQIRLFDLVFDYQMLDIIFSEKGFFFIVMLFTAMLINYGISSVILKAWAKFKKHNNDAK